VLTPAQLHDEITRDPEGLGYARFVESGEDDEIAALLNAPRDGAALPAGTMPTEQLSSAIGIDEYLALDADRKAWLGMITKNPTIVVSHALAKDLLGLFPKNTALPSIVFRPASRAQQLAAALDPAVRHQDVSIAIRERKHIQEWTHEDGSVHAYEIGVYPKGSTVLQRHAEPIHLGDG
jgi:hypothetical protein